ncbi:MAG: hypothetical protein JSS11_00180 [Verrucomicrobia bacterium]|nr:hypothetical protein [Verrucomicrobiota bacterium]
MNKFLTKAPLVSAVRARASRRLKRLSRKEVFGLVFCLVLLATAVVVAIFVSDEVDWRALSRSMGEFDPVIAVILMALLPLMGFPISVVYLAIGARFGPVAGFPIVAGITAFHLGATYWITRSFLRKPLDRFIARRGYHLPEVQPGEEAAVGLLAALVPGLPYFVRNYLLALTDIRLRVIFGVCLPVYVARSYVTIMIGDLANDPRSGQFFLLAGVYVIKLGICAWIVWRLRRHRHPKAAK